MSLSDTVPPVLSQSVQFVVSLSYTIPPIYTFNVISIYTFNELPFLLLSQSPIWVSLSDAVPPAISVIPTRIYYGSTTFCLEHLLDDSDVDSKFDACKKELGVPDSFKKNVKLDITRYNDAAPLYRCLAVKVGLISDNSTGKLDKTELIKRINRKDYDDERKRYLRNQATTCHYWDACRKTKCNLNRVKIAAKLAKFRKKCQTVRSSACTKFNSLMKGK